MSQLDLYAKTIRCDECNGTGVVEGQFSSSAKPTCEKCLVCQGNGIADEYTCACCGTVCGIVESPPYQSGATYCCKPCAIIERLDDLYDKLHHGLSVIRMGGMLSDLDEVRALVEQLYREAREVERDSRHPRIAEKKYPHAIQGDRT